MSTEMSLQDKYDELSNKYSTVLEMIEKMAKTLERVEFALNTTSTSQSNKEVIKNTLNNSSTPMGRLYSNFNLDESLINNFLTSYNGMIAGSAASLPFIDDQENIPEDIDIWVKVRPFEPNFDILRNFENEKKYRILNALEPDIKNVMSDFDKLMDNANYKQIFEHRAYLDNAFFYKDGQFNGIIYKIRSYEYKGKKIQLILTYVDQKEVLESFDLSFCATSWNGKEFFSMDEELTKKKMGYRLRPEFNEREKNRELKYISRGFTIVEK
uniref:Uncharacterized protein n=1 Tax=viral metagenome TaxID=1070528 RepID=A0A6C0AFC9_9ZZZZ